MADVALSKRGQSENKIRPTLEEIRNKKKLPYKYNYINSGSRTYRLVIDNDINIPFNLKKTLY